MVWPQGFVSFSQVLAECPKTFFSMLEKNQKAPIVLLTVEKHTEGDEKSKQNG